MATVSDITVTPLSGLKHIDALLDKGPDWNFLPVPKGSSLPGNNTIVYTFSTLSGNEQGQTGQEAFTLSQQANTRTALDYISQLTHIQFVESSIGTDAQLHFCNIDIPQANVTGLCSWHSTYGYDNGLTYDVDAYVYLDNVQFRSTNMNLTPETRGYQTLLHELGHALGLKHPFEAEDENPTTLDTVLENNTSKTLMSYTESGGPYSKYSPYDIAALNWLYGGDGLGGALGINSTSGGRYLTGTSGADTLTGTAANDKLEGDGGNDMIDGGLGFDTAVFRGARNSYTFGALANGDLTVTSKDGLDGADILRSIELLQFSDMSASRADILAVTDTVAPAVPTLVVTKNANGYATGNTPLVTGRAEPGSVIKIYTADNQQVGTVTADVNGLWSTKLSVFADGLNYRVYATATDAAGNVSMSSEPATFNVDSIPPVNPTYSMSYDTGGNQVSFTGTGEANSTIELLHAGADFKTIARTTVGADGKWDLTTSPLPNGSYTLSVVSLDMVNGASAPTRATFTINNPGNLTGTKDADVLKPGVGNNGIDGGAGIDMAVYAGPRANFTVAQEAWGFGVTDKVGNNGHDALINVERVQFDDGWLALDVDGSAGQIFRLYSAAFSREAEPFGLGYWIWRMDDGTSIQQVSKEFMRQVEFDTMYGVNPSDEVFIKQLYLNVLHRAPDADGFQYWMNTLGHNSNPDKAEVRAQMLIDFSDSLENVKLVAENVKHGLDYLPYHL
jgi:hypothetical protein